MKVERIAVTLEPWSYRDSEMVVLRTEAKVYPGGVFTAERVVHRNDVVPLLEIMMCEATRVISERLREHLEGEAENGSG